MVPFTNPFHSNQRLAQTILVIAALESLLQGAWALFYPEGLLSLLAARQAPDALLLERALGLLIWAHVPCLALAAVRPMVWGDLVLVPLVGRALTAGLWLWLLGTDRVELATQPLILLAGHDLLWVALFIGFLCWGPRGTKKGA
jgi:hypothetical protein